MAEAKKPTGVFDISKPGAPKVSATPTSRPIIIKHQNVQDPMVNDTPKPEEVTVPVAEVPSTHKVVIQPIHDSVDTKPADPEPAITEKPIAEEPKAVKKPEKPLEEPVKTAEASVDSPAIDSVPDTNDRTELVQSLVTSGEYFLPIETIEARRSKRAIAFGSLCILVLLLAWYDVALDAKLIPNTYNLPHTSYFTN